MDFDPATLGAWLDILQPHARDCKLQDAAHVQRGVVVLVSIPVELFRPEIPRTDAAAKRDFRRLREAIDLLYLALQADPFMVFSNRSQLHPDTREAFETGAPIELELVAIVTHIPDLTPLCKYLGEYLLETLSASASTDEEFVRARAWLLNHDHSGRNWRDSLERQPVPLQVWIETPVNVELTAMGCEDFVHSLAKFMKIADKADIRWSPESQDHIPLRVERVKFDLHRFAITERVVHAYRPIMSTKRLHLDVWNVVLDPRLVSCSKDNLAAFLSDLSRFSTDLFVIRVGHELPRFQPARPIDAAEVDRSEIIIDLLHGVRQCEKVTRLDISELLSMCTSPRSRTVIFAEVITAVLSRALPIDLVLGKVSVSEVDVSCILEGSAIWKSINPGAKLRVRRLWLSLEDPGHRMAEALTTVIDELEELSIVNHDLDSGVIPSSVIEKVLNAFPGLRRLQVSTARIESMMIFYDPPRPSLESIDLCHVQLVNHDSFLAFATALGDDSSSLAKTLLHFALSEHADTSWIGLSEVFRIKEREVQALEKALTSNRVLRTLQFTYRGASRPEQARFCHALETAGGPAVPALRRERNTTDEVKRRLAFISTITKHNHVNSARAQLDAVIVRQILEFDLLTVPREVVIHHQPLDEIEDSMSWYVRTELRTAGPALS